MLRIVPHTVPRVDRSHEHIPVGFNLHLPRGVGGIADVPPHSQTSTVPGRGEQRFTGVPRS